ncbi:pduH protein [Planotetraspora thailandica]|uniref:PduH protein n=1 Tax=Planotetraspora thailandica TaxID=487172 RepID=A0A8J3VA81_9ACTN|nr:glycerol dehydratase reactivase beta/small subunit family protein [Planotetraspora thailandica]GII57871.1 pduH protein [Planotetraspora thailandica]
MTPVIAVMVWCDPGLRSRRCMRDLTAGIEEEGVPYHLESGTGGSVELAYAAAQASGLGVGVGVDADGNVCVHHAKLPSDMPAVTGPASAARIIGHNAARLVVGVPLKQPDL